MGNNNSTPTTRQGNLKKPMKMMRMSCSDDLMCQNINATKSIPGQTPILVCPDAKCMAGTCECGPDCKKDPYTNMCCKSIEERVTKTSSGEQKTTFCIENFTTISGNLSYGKY
jgi:hypothetical protein